jgi:hypothetical protein
MEMKMSQEITNHDDIIDSRDVIARIEELEEELESDWDELDHDEFLITKEEFLEKDEYEELRTLKALAEECEGCSDWIHGETLIHENYFTEYQIDTLKDCGILPQDIPSYVVIDEEATADNLKGDYTTVNFDGETYYIRSI